NTPPQTFHADTPYGSPPPAGWVPGWVQRLGSGIANLGRTARGIVHGNVNPDFRRGLHVSADWVTGLMPGASDVRDIAEVGLGRDIVTGEPLTGPQRAVTLVAAALPFISGSVMRRTLGKLAKGSHQNHGRGSCQSRQRIGGNQAESVGGRSQGQHVKGCPVLNGPR